MVYFKENHTYPRFQRGSNISQGGPTFSRGGGVQMLISIETYKTCDFPGGSRPPIPASGSGHAVVGYTVVR